MNLPDQISSYARRLWRSRTLWLEQTAPPDPQEGFCWIDPTSDDLTWRAGGETRTIPRGGGTLDYGLITASVDVTLDYGGLA